MEWYDCGAAHFLKLTALILLLFAYLWLHLPERMNRLCDWYEWW